MRMRILIAAPFIPYPARSGMNIRVMEIARRFAREHEVIFALALRWGQDEEYCNKLREQGFGVIAMPGNVGRNGRTLYHEGLLALAKGRPPLNGMRGSRALEQELTRRVESFDVIQLEYEIFGNLPYLFRDARRPILSIVLHDLMAETTARIADIDPSLIARLGRRINVPLFRRFERRELPRYDVAIVMSKRERDLVARHMDESRIMVIPNCANLSLPMLEEPRNPAPVILFIGQMEYLPNIDAARWLVREIFPLIRAAYPEARLLLVGKNPDPARLGFNGQGVEYVGEVEDLTPYYRQTDVVVTPLRAGGGTRLKILEAMTYGRPVVSTSLGAEGLDAVAGRHLMTADSAAAIAEAALALFRDPVRRAAMRTEARAMVQARFNWDDAAATLLDRYLELHRQRVKAGD